MMPVTGNNNNSHKKILSIRLWRGGLSFYMPLATRAGALCVSRVVADAEAFVQTMENALTEIAVESAGVEYDSVQVFIDTADTVFIPQELVDRADMKELLVEAGIKTGLDSAIVVSDPLEGLVAVSAICREYVKALQDRFRGKLRFFSPIHELLSAFHMSGLKKDIIALYPTESNVYVLQYNESDALVVAEAYPCCTEADAIYYCSQLTSNDKANKVRIVVYGERALRFISTVKKYYRKTSQLKVTVK